MLCSEDYIQAVEGISQKLTTEGLLPYALIMELKFIGLIARELEIYENKVIP